MKGQARERDITVKERGAVVAVQTEAFAADGGSEQVSECIHAPLLVFLLFGQLYPNCCYLHIHPSHFQSPRGGGWIDDITVSLPAHIVVGHLKTIKHTSLCLPRRVCLVSVYFVFIHK